MQRQKKIQTTSRVYLKMFCCLKAKKILVDIKLEVGIFSGNEGQTLTARKLVLKFETVLKRSSIL